MTNVQNVLVRNAAAVSLVRGLLGAFPADLIASVL
jgi:hypothetical protein